MASIHLLLPSDFWLNDAVFCSYRASESLNRYLYQKKITWKSAWISVLPTFTVIVIVFFQNKLLHVSRNCRKQDQRSKVSCENTSVFFAELPFLIMIPLFPNIFSDKHQESRLYYFCESVKMATWLVILRWNAITASAKIQTQFLRKTQQILFDINMLSRITNQKIRIAALTSKA